MTTVLPNGELQSNPRIAYNKGYKQGKADGAREFAEWLCNTEYVANHDSFILPLRGCFTVDEVLAEWQKGEKQ